MGSAELQGALWGQGAREWADSAESTAIPAYEAAFDVMGLGSGSTLLDAGCGAGLALAMAQARGATPVGLDASAGLLAIARERLPEVDLREGEIEEMPFDDDSFDAVSAFNSVQFAADPRGALLELVRVARPGAPVAVVIWGPAQDCEMHAVFAALAKVATPPPGAAGPFTLSAPGVFESLLDSTGLIAESDELVETPFVFSDVVSAVRGLASTGPGLRASQVAGAEVVSRVLTDAFGAFATAGAGPRLENVFRLILLRASAGVGGRG